MTIGTLTGEGAPVIGKNVFIGVRAILLGAITIGDNAKIGAGSVVLCDVPEYCTAAGNLCRIIKSEELKNE